MDASDARIATRSSASERSAQASGLAGARHGVSVAPFVPSPPRGHARPAPLAAGARHADSDATLSPATDQRFEREANQGAAELLFQGRRFRRMAGDYGVSLGSVVELAQIVAASAGHAPPLLRGSRRGGMRVVPKPSPVERDPLAYERIDVTASRMGEPLRVRLAPDPHDGRVPFRVAHYKPLRRRRGHDPSRCMSTPSRWTSASRAPRAGSGSSCSSGCRGARPSRASEACRERHERLARKRRAASLPLCRGRGPDLRSEAFRSALAGRRGGW
jgi:hypothetical protein